MAIYDVINGEKIVKYEGCVAYLYEHNGSWDSDFYAVCYDPETGEKHTVEYATTRFGCYGTATVDLTADNFIKYLKNGGYDRKLKNIIQTAVINAKVVKMGKKVVVTRGRKVKHGVIGTIFWEREEVYGYNSTVTKIGIKDDDGEVYWTYAHNCEVYDPGMYYDVNTIKRKYEKSLQEYIKTLR